jgi:indole-3-glycerol phosphate synthase
VQASPVWTPPQGTLGGIVAEAFERAAGLREREAELRRRAELAPAAPSLAGALRGANVGVIAEVKRRSPSKGWINPGLTAADQARAYERGGAAAVSVLTEPIHFGGSVDDLETVRASIAIPVLKKDFHVQPIQLFEAKAIGASAALLIARALSPDALVRMADVARSLALEVLVEVRDEDELARALDVGASLIGINNRNLESLVIEEGTAERLLAHMPASVVAISESGIERRSDIERIASAGADAVLVGSAISAAADPVAAVRGLVGVRRVPRAR